MKMIKKKLDKSYSGQEYRDKLNLKIGSMVSSLRKKRGYTQEEMAQKLGIPQGTLSKLENGKSDIKLYQLFLFLRTFEGESKNH